MPNTLYEEKATIIKAMAHPSRLVMMDALARSELCVCDLQRLVGSDMSTVSKHLSVMRAAGLVESRKVGLQVFYRLRVPCIMQFFSCVEAVMAARLANLSGQEFLPEDLPVMCSVTNEERPYRGEAI